MGERQLPDTWTYDIDIDMKPPPPHVRAEKADDDGPFVQAYARDDAGQTMRIYASEAHPAAVLAVLDRAGLIDDGPRTAELEARVRELESVVDNDAGVMADLRKNCDASTKRAETAKRDGRIHLASLLCLLKPDLSDDALAGMDASALFQQAVIGAQEMDTERDELRAALREEKMAAKLRQEMETDEN